MGIFTKPIGPVFLKDTSEVDPRSEERRVGKECRL